MRIPVSPHPHRRSFCLWLESPSWAGRWLPARVWVCVSLVTRAVGHPLRCSQRFSALLWRNAYPRAWPVVLPGGRAFLFTQTVSPKIKFKEGALERAKEGTISKGFPPETPTVSGLASFPPHPRKSRLDGKDTDKSRPQPNVTTP